MRDIDKTKEELIAELNALRTLKKCSVGSLADSDDNPLIYKQVLDDLPQMVYEFDTEGCVTYVNRETIRLFGYSAEEVEQGIAAKDVFHPQDRERALANLRRILEGDTITGEEYQAVRKDGSVFPVQIFSQPVLKSGKPIGVRGTVVDISKSIHAKEALRKSEAYYRTLFNNTGTAMVIFDNDAIIKSCNDQFADLCGYSKAEVEGNYKWSDFVAAESLEMITKFHKKRSKGSRNVPADYEFTFLSGDGRRRLVHVFVKIIPGTNYRVCSLIDITRRKETEQALRRSEERYELVVRGANDGIWDWDLESDSVYYSPRYKAILGYEDHEFANTSESWKTHVHPDDIDYVIEANLECIQGKMKQFGVEYRMRHKDGSWRWIHGRGACVHNDEGKVYRLAGTHTDITVRKIQEQTTNALYDISKAVSTSYDLQHLFKNIHSILNGVIDATNFFICIYDHETDSASLTYVQDEVDTYGVIENISDPATRTPTAEIIRTGKPLVMSKQTPEALRQWDVIGSVGTPAAAWVGVPLKVRDTIIGTMTVQHYSDPYRYNESDIAIMKTASEQVALAIDRKRSEEALTKLNEELESKVEERTTELKRRTRELEAANLRLTKLDEIKSALVSSISHELRTPLTSIRGFAKLAGKDFNRLFLPLANTPELNRKGARILANLGIIGSEGERLTRLINDFLDINRIESGKASWNDILFNPADVVSMAVSALSGVFADKQDVVLIADLPPNVSPILADPDKIQQVLINLLGNAAKFTQRGAVTVSLRDNLDAITVSVSDTGAGIPQEELEHIFEKFHKSRTGDTITKADRGTGLGLAICREIISHYGGSIWVESILGKGSTFSFSLGTAKF